MLKDEVVKLFLISLCLSGFSVARADPQQKRPQIEAQGVVQPLMEFNYYPKYYAHHNGALAVHARLQLVPWGEGKAKIILVLEETKWCAGAQLSVTGLEMADGAFELYGADQVESIGSAAVTNTAIFLSFDKGLRLESAAKSDFSSTSKTCIWYFYPTNQIELSRKR